MRRRRNQTFRVLFTTGCMLTAYLLYTQTFGQMTRYPQLPKRYLVPLAEPTELTEATGVVESSGRDLEQAAIRAFGAECAELNYVFKINFRADTGGNVAGRGLGTYVFAEDYQIVPDNPRQVRWSPFSLVHVGANDSGVPEKDEITTVRGKEAIFEFDRSIELTKFSQLSPVSIKVVGTEQSPVQLTMNRGTADLTDDVVILMEELHFDTVHNKVWSPSKVRVTIESEDVQIEGVELEVYLDKPKAESGEDWINSAEPNMVRLYKDIKFHLVVDDDSNFLGPSINPDKAGPKKATKSDRTPLTISAKGGTDKKGFSFDLKAQKATFERMVRVLRTLPGDKPDEHDMLDCDTLELVFADDPKQEPTSSAPNDAGRRIANSVQRLKSVTATGKTVILLSASQHLQVAGSYLFHDADQRRSEIKGQDRGNGKPTMVAHYEDATIEALALVIEHGANDEVRTLIADGPDGRLEINQSAKPDGKATTSRITWKGQLKVEGSETGDERVVTITGDVEVDDNRGALRCEQLKIWLTTVEVVDRAAPLAPPPQIGETPRFRGSRKLEPIKVEANRDVSLISDALEVTTETLSMTILYPRGEPTVVTNASVVQPEGSAKAEPPNILKSARPRADNAPKQEPVDVRATSVSVVLKRVENETTLEQAWAEGQVFVHHAPKEEGRQPLTIKGQSLNFQRQAGGDVAEVEGAGSQQAIVQYADMQLGCVGTISLNELTNKVIVTGPGFIERETANSLTGRPAAAPQRLRIDWRRSMTFDGQRAFFEQQVVGQQETTRIQCETMDVTFDDRIDFKKARQQQERQNKEQPKIRRVECAEKVYVIDIERVEGVDNRVVTIDVTELHFDNTLQTSEAQGPGLIRIVERSRPEVDATGKTVPPASPWQLTTVAFAGQMNASNQRQVIKFFEKVHIVHTPIAQPQEKINEQALPPEGLTIDADKAETGIAQRESERFRSFIATGNVHFHTQEYWGQAARLNYDEQKQMLVFEGNPNQRAEFYRRRKIGEKAMGPISAKIIRYFRNTGEIELDGAEGFNIIMAPGDAKELK